MSLTETKGGLDGHPRLPRVEKVNPIRQRIWDLSQSKFRRALNTCYQVYDDYRLGRGKLQRIPHPRATLEEAFQESDYNPPTIEAIDWLLNQAGTNADWREAPSRFAQYFSQNQLRRNPTKEDIYTGDWLNRQELEELEVPFKVTKDGEVEIDPKYRVVYDPASRRGSRQPIIAHPAQIHEENKFAAAIKSLLEPKTTPGSDNGKVAHREVEPNVDAHIRIWGKEPPQIGVYPKSEPEPSKTRHGIDLRKKAASITTGLKGLKSKISEHLPKRKTKEIEDGQTIEGSQPRGRERWKLNFSKEALVDAVKDRLVDTAIGTAVGIAARAVATTAGWEAALVGGAVVGAAVSGYRENRKISKEITETPDLEISGGRRATRIAIACGIGAGTGALSAIFVPQIVDWAKPVVGNLAGEAANALDIAGKVGNFIGFVESINLPEKIQNVTLGADSVRQSIGNGIGEAARNIDIGGKINSIGNLTQLAKDSAGEIASGISTFLSTQNPEMPNVDEVLSNVANFVSEIPNNMPKIDLPEIHLPNIGETVTTSMPEISDLGGDVESARSFIQPGAYSPIIEIPDNAEEWILDANNPEGAYATAIQAEVGKNVGEVGKDLSYIEYGLQRGLEQRGLTMENMDKLTLDTNRFHLLHVLEDAANWAFDRHLQDAVRMNLSLDEMIDLGRDTFDEWLDIHGLDELVKEVDLDLKQAA